MILLHLSIDGILKTQNAKRIKEVKRVLRNNSSRTFPLFAIIARQIRKSNFSLENWEIRIFCAVLNHVKEAEHLYTNKRQQN